MLFIKMIGSRMDMPCILFAGIYIRELKRCGQNASVYVEMRYYNLGRKKQKIETTFKMHLSSGLGGKYYWFDDFLL